jgi:hypothetical protein
MKVKFLSTTHNLAKPIVGQEVELKYTDKAYFKFDPEGLGFDLRRGEWRTSLLENIKFKETSRSCYTITITTMNSEYVFQKGTPSDKLPYTKEELLDMQMAMMF